MTCVVPGRDGVVAGVGVWLCLPSQSQNNGVRVPTLDPTSQSPWTANSDIDVGTALQSTSYFLLVVALYWGVQVRACTCAGLRVTR